MRWRLLAWYAAVLVAVITGFAVLLYVQIRRLRLQKIDEQLTGAVEYIDATLRRLPPPEFDEPGALPFGLPPFGRGGSSLTPEQRQQIEALDADARARLNRILTPEQQQRLESLRPAGQRRGPPPDGPRPRPDGPVPPSPADPGNSERDRNRPSPAQMHERVLADLGLPPSLVPPNDDLPEDEAYFVVWRRNGSLLKTSPSASETASVAVPVDRDSVTTEVIHRQRGLAREALKRGPHATVILVGIPIGREFAELSSFGWRLAGTGSLALAIGLAGGWGISRGIVRPIERIADTAGAISATNLAGRIDTAQLDAELIGLAQVLNEMFSRLERAFARQARFTADASHELRTPVALLHTQIELALKRPRTVDEYREALETCRRASGRMRSLLDGLLTLARADAGHLALSLQPTNLNELVDEVSLLYRDDARQSHVILETTIPAASVMVQGDPVFLSRVLANLLTNALRHTPESGTIHISLATDTSDAILTVADSGCGIPEEDQPQIFERFFRVDRARSRSSGGNGLGLAICKSIVEAHAGTITFSSQADRGTTFVVRIPGMTSAHRRHADLTTGLS